MEIVADILGIESVESISDGSSDMTVVVLVRVGVVPSEGDVSGELFRAFCSFFFANASVILRRITSSPCWSCDKTLVSCVCMPANRTGSLCILAICALVSPLVTSILVDIVGEVGVPCLSVLPFEDLLFCSVGRGGLLDFIFVPDSDLWRKMISTTASWVQPSQA